MHARHEAHRGILSMDFYTGSISYVTGGMKTLKGILNRFCREALHGSSEFEN
jgi:hypothetical protein